MMRVCAGSCDVSSCVIVTSDTNLEMSSSRVSIPSLSQSCVSRWSITISPVRIVSSKAADVSFTESPQLGRTTCYRDVRAVPLRYRHPQRRVVVPDRTPTRDTRCSSQVEVDRRRYLEVEDQSPQSHQTK